MRTNEDRPGRTVARAFTLIELIVVITILGILVTLILPRIIGRVGEAKRTVAESNIHTLELKVQEFYADCERLPTSQEGLGALVQAPADVTDRWKGAYVKAKDILDPWGNEFRYLSPGRHNRDYDIFTYGADGQEGGEDENADIGNW